MPKYSEIDLHLSFYLISPDVLKVPHLREDIEPLRHNSCNAEKVFDSMALRLVR